MPWPGKERMRVAAGLALIAAACVILCVSPRATVLVETRAQLKRQIAADFGSTHPHPRVRGGVFTKTLKELSGAIQDLARPSGGLRKTQHTWTEGYNLMQGALRTGPAPAEHKSVQSAANRVDSIVKVLEKSEATALASAQKIEHQIEQLRGRGSALSAGPGGSSRGRQDRGLSEVAAKERRAVLSSLRLQQLKTENCSLAKQFDKNLTTLPLIDTKKKCELPNVWDDANGECVESPLVDEWEQPLDCTIRGPQSCVCHNWAEAHAFKVEEYRKLLRESFIEEESINNSSSFRYEEEYGKLLPGGQRQYKYDGYDRTYRRGIFMGGRRHPGTKWGKPVPQRFPHKSGADLGDNWISSFSDRHGDNYGTPHRHGGYAAYEEDLSRELDDHMAPASEPLSRTPLSLRPFLGGKEDEGRWSKNSMRLHRQSYWRKGAMSKADKDILSGNTRDAVEARKFADWDYAMGNAKSPLEESNINLLFGTAHKYLDDHYGGLGDAYPSTKEVYKQILQPNEKAVNTKRMQDKRFPRITHLVQRWRKHRAVLERPEVPCTAPDCSLEAPLEAPPLEHVRVCNPLTGCHIVKGPALQPKDSLQDQILKGAQDGVADPWGFGNELADDKEDAAAVLGARHEDHSFGYKWGEPLSDFLHGNWDLRGGVTANEHDTKTHELDKAIEYPRYYPYTKGQWKGLPDDGEADDGEAEQ